MPGTFKAYLHNIQAKTGKSPEDFYKLATGKGFIKRGKIVAEHAEMLDWLKSEIKLGHVHANFIILYLRLRTNDPRGGANIKKWARETGYEAP
ncbi:MAG: DUF4287 domain-containing protein [Candidatus Micrarchaeota archaeon]|nr:DUF4287 domain-containing protein [Candidatus Micrarchaeota archaeon]